MKKNKRILFIVVLFVALMIPSMVNAANEITTTVNGVPYSYTLNKWDQIEDLKCLDVTKISGAYTVPGTIDGYEVIGLRYNAFKGATEITSLTISNSIKKVDNDTFAECRNLMNVDLGTLETIGFDAFENCDSLKTITIPKTLINGNSTGVFTGTTKLTSITFENGLPKIPAGILMECTGITQVSIPNSVTTIGYYAFEESGLTSIVLPNNVKTIEYNAFRGCKNLNNVNLGAVEELEWDVFKNCDSLKIIKIPKTLINGPTVDGVFTGTTKLTSITFENGLTKIPEGILMNCTGITQISIPNSVTTIGSYAFEESGLTSIILPSSVKKINYNAFRGCRNLASVNLGAVEELGWDVFKNCESLKTIKIPKTLVNGPSVDGVFTGTTKLTSITFENGLTKIPEGILMNCTGITQISIPNSVTTIGSYAFEESGLTSVTIPSSVTKINYNAFKNCKNLTKVVIPASVTSIGWDVFDGTSKDLVLHVAYGSKAHTYAIEEKIKYVTSTIPITSCKISGIENKVYSGYAQTQGVLIKYGNTVLSYGTDYTLSYSNNVNPGKATVKITGKGTYSGTVTKTFIIRPKKVTGVKTKTYGTNYVTISWSKATGATGYTIYSYNESSKKYQALGSIKNTAVNIRNLKANKKYKFRIKAYKTIDGSKYYGEYSSTLTTGTKPSTVKISSVKSKSSKKATVKWKKVTGASGYEVYMATSKKGKYSKVKTVTKGSTVSYTKSSLKKKKTYYVKVRAYKTINGKKVYGSYSSVKSVKVK